MALTRIQKEIMASIAGNRSDTSYVAGGLVLNMDWPRMSDDIDIFHDTDEEIGVSADTDIAKLEADGFKVSIEVNVYGCVEASVIRDGERTLVQWMSETRTRFFPLVRDDEWGSRLHPSDLAVNKVIAASTRTKARDYVDLLMIENYMCPLGPVIMAAAGKPPYFSPLRIVDEIRRKALSVTNEDYTTVRGLPSDWTAAVIRDELIIALDYAENYLRNAPPELVGILAIDISGVPLEVYDLSAPGVGYRKATSEPEVIPDLPEAGSCWGDLA
ncbi:nucleotidyl transferase AbiEii/AbiGii toxin family protein [Rhizobium cauense]|uniref:nucleotidyl transferase AbiEii/AbiGii toxin family protein n=1 Tax=Rhizobium cauense TaxID=1166683 RepID=UPI001C6E9A47|nr:nucleotidyl transferase AbiEii/AbiGii toxin family protein [Rhizobium cauense]MBW9117700.1 nucleotidyl transferase AbiEii/AbiGii toxin family protein [Rhizobium cauense]